MINRTNDKKAAGHFILINLLNTGFFLFLSRWLQTQTLHQNFICPRKKTKTS